MIRISDANMNTLGGRAETVQEIFEAECEVLNCLEDGWVNEVIKAEIQAEEKAMLFAVQMLKAVLEDDREVIERYARIANGCVARLREKARMCNK